MDQGASANLDRKRDRKEVTDKKDNSLPRLMITYVTKSLRLKTNAKTWLFTLVSFKDLKTLNAIDIIKQCVSIQMKAVLRGSISVACYRPSPFRKSMPLTNVLKYKRTSFQKEFPVHVINFADIALATEVTMACVRLILFCLKKRIG